MQVKLSSGDREILNYGTVFLFDPNANLKFDIDTDDSFRFSMSIAFKEDASVNRDIEVDFTEKHIQITCINFTSSGTGLTTPLELAVVNGKKIYFIFWAYLEGNETGKPKVRKIEYTLYREQ